MAYPSARQRSISCISAGSSVTLCGVNGVMLCERSSVSGKITDMETLVRYPATEGAARLAGNGNFLPAEGSTVAMDILAEKCFCYRRA